MCIGEETWIGTDQAVRLLIADVKKLKDEIAMLKQRSHTHKFTTLPVCERCNEVQSLCGCPHKFPPSNY